MFLRIGVFDIILCSGNQHRPFVDYLVDDVIFTFELAYHCHAKWPSDK